MYAENTNRMEISMKLIPLWCGDRVVAATLVDDFLYGLLVRLGDRRQRWAVSRDPRSVKNGKGGARPYACYEYREGRSNHWAWMHRLVLRLARMLKLKRIQNRPGCEPNHINRDTLDNRLENLRMTVQRKNRVSQPNKRVEGVYIYPETYEALKELRTRKVAA